jgi:hypothetical protein
MVAHICNPSTRDVEAGEFQVRGQPGLWGETLCHKQINKERYIKSLFYPDLPYRNPFQTLRWLKKVGSLTTKENSLGLEGNYNAKIRSM